MSWPTIKFLCACAATPLLLHLGLAAAAVQSPESPPLGGCRYVQAGPSGPTGNLLLIERNIGGVGLRREGPAIVVYSPHTEKGSVLDCEGPEATVHNIDRIVYRPPGGGDPPRIAHKLEVDLKGGVFQPGAGPDHAGGGGEIEIIADFPREPPNKWSSIFVTGSDSGDRMRVGALSRGRTGVNLDFRRDHYVYDADLIVSAAPDAHFVFKGEGGNDFFAATGRGLEFEGPIRQSSLVMVGGNGSDTIYGGPQRDLLGGEAGADSVYSMEGRDRLTGGEGNDRLFGGDGDDEIAAGRDDGRPFYDSLFGGSGHDALYAIDGNADYVRCGAGPDQTYIDAIDEWSRASCEKQHGPDFN
jgi:RTX calcium-binding nonapeptide repeat (4 copies)